MGANRSLVDFGFRTLTTVHRMIVRVSGGRLGARAFGMPVVELHTVGRRSGRRYTTMLTAPVIDGERVVLVASKGGDDRDPDWFRNAMAHPEVELTMNGTRRAVRTRRASDEEKAELWPRVIASYKSYGNYQRRTSRNIPLVICEPSARP